MKIIQPLLLFVCGLLLVVSIAGPVAAQGTDTCPTNVLLALARAGAVCNNIENNQACNGNGVVEAVFQPGITDVSFGTTGDVVDVAALRQLRVDTPGDDGTDWSVAMLHVQANLVGTEQRNVTMLLFGDAEIENLVPPLPELTATATGTLNIRVGPEVDADIVERLNVRDTVVANGRVEDGDWLRVVIPGTSDLGWVSMEVVDVDNDIATLDVVDESTPYFRPFQVMTLSTGVDDAPCDGVSNSGVLIQTPNTFTPVEMTVNGVTLHLAATVYVQAQAGESMVINVLDGQVEAEAFDTMHFIPAGSRTQISLEDDLMASGAPISAEHYTMADLEALPVNNLPFRFSIPSPLTEAEIEAILAEYVMPEPTAIPTAAATEIARCERIVQQTTNLRSGPGAFYEVVRDITSGTRVSPVFRVTGADDVVWWQLNNGHWLPANVVEVTGPCSDVPITDTIQAPPYNFMTLESCIPDNGPLRDGQQVTFEFRPWGWDTYEEAVQAANIPGRITVDSQPLSVRISDPVQLSAERFVRTFTANWTVTAGTHRIVGGRLTYSVICNVTVPAGN